jgi:ABC-2 type transport system ATP-binding protein
VSLRVVDGAAAIAPVVRALDEAGFAVEGIELVRPTLDDVFAEKTGHRLEGADVAPAAEPAVETEPPVPA